MKKCIILFVFIFSFYINSNAQQLDKKIVSLYVFNFTKHILWPNFSSPQFIIGVVGSQNDVQELIRLASSRKVNDKQVVVKPISQSNVTESKECQILLIKEENSQLLSKYLSVLSDTPILIVTEKKGLIKKGASVTLFLDEDDDFKTKFQLNKTKIEQNGLKVSAELVALSAK